MKALIKHELRNIWGVTLLFVTLAVAMGMVLSQICQESLEIYIAGGWGYTETTFLACYQGIAVLYTVLMLVGLVVLVAFQFREHKSTAISQFLASLPYTHTQVYRVKLLMGILSYTLSFMVFTLVVSVQWMEHIPWLEKIERVSPIGSYLETGNDLNSILISIAISYGLVTVMYLLLCLMQYVVANCIVSLVITSLCIASIPYMGIALMSYVSDKLDSQKALEFINGIGEKIIYFFNSYSQKSIQIIDGRNEDYAYYYYTLNELIEWRVLVIISVILMLLVAIHTLSERYGLGKESRLIVSKGFEWVFKGGVTLCSAFIPVWFVSMLGMMYNQIGIGLEIAMIVVGGVGYCIAHKLTTLGKV